MVEEVDIVDADSAIDWAIDRASFTQWWADAAEHLAITPGLSSRAVAVLELRHGLTGEAPRTLDQIGQRYGVTRERNRQIEKKALEALRECSQRD